MIILLYHILAQKKKPGNLSFSLTLFKSHYFCSPKQGKSLNFLQMFYHFHKYIEDQLAHLLPNLCHGRFDKHETDQSLQCSLRTPQLQKDWKRFIWQLLPHKKTQVQVLSLRSNKDRTVLFSIHEKHLPLRYLLYRIIQCFLNTTPFLSTVYTRASPLMRNRIRGLALVIKFVRAL